MPYGTSNTPVTTTRCRSSGPFGPHSPSANGSNADPAAAGAGAVPGRAAIRIGARQRVVRLHRHARHAPLELEGQRVVPRLVDPDRILTSRQVVRHAEHPLEVVGQHAPAVDDRVDVQLCASRCAPRRACSRPRRSCSPPARARSRVRLVGARIDHVRVEPLARRAERQRVALGRLRRKRIDAEAVVGQLADADGRVRQRGQRVQRPRFCEMMSRPLPRC